MKKYIKPIYNIYNLFCSTAKLVLAYLTLTVLAMVILPGLAATSLLNELSEDEKKAVLGQLKDKLPELIEDETVKGYLTTLGDNVENWSSLAGEISAGQFENAVQASLNWGKDQLTEQVSEEIEARITAKLGEGTAGMAAYEYLKGKPEELKKVARAALSANWKEAGKIIWETARSDATQKIQEHSETALKNAFNWIFDNRTVGGYTPADIFLAAVEFEKEFIPYFKRKTTKEKLDQIWEKYTSFLGSPPNHAAAWQALVDHGYDFGGRSGYGTWDIPPQDLRQLLAGCEGSASLYECMKIEIEAKQAELENQKKALQAAVAEARAEQDRKLKDALAKIRSELNALAAKERDKKKYEESMQEARSIFAKLGTAAGVVQQACQEFDAQADIAQGALNKVRDAEEAAKRIDACMKSAQECEQLTKDFQSLADQVEKGKTIKSEFDQLLKDSEDVKNEVCKAAGEIANAPSKKEAKERLREVMDAARTLETAVADVEAKGAELRRLGETITQSVAEFKAQQEKVTVLKGDLSACENELQTIEAVKGAKEEFETALSAMKAAVQQTTNLAQFAKDILKGDSISGVRDGIQYLLGKMKTRMETLVGPYKGIDEVDKMLEETPKLVESMECADRLAKLWGDKKSKKGRWNFRKWRDPSLPGDLAVKLRAAEEACEKTPAADGPQDLLRQLLDLVADMETEEVGAWIYKREGDRCVADALEAYANFNEKADQDLSALAKEIDKVEAICQQAQQDHDNALKSANAALQASGKIDALARQIEAGLKQIEGDLAACRNAPTERSAAALAYSDAARWAGRARQGLDGALSKATACTSKESMAEVDELLNASEAVAVGAARKFQQGEQHRKNLDDIIARVKQANDKAAQLAHQASSIAAEVAVVNGHISTANGFRTAADDGFAACDGGKTDLLGRLDTLAAKLENPDSERITALRSRIYGLGPDSPPSYSAFDQHLANANGAIQKRPDMAAKANAVSSKFSACYNIEPLSGEWFNAGQAINELDNLDQLKADIARAKQKCMDQLNTGDGCPPENPDTDEDGVCDSDDKCPGHDDKLDADADGVPDGCDKCPGHDDKLDADADGVPDGCDKCPGHDDKLDADADGVSDGCDKCPGHDDKLDADADGVPDGCDKCPGHNDKLDADADGVSDGCDKCPGRDDKLDTDGDGIPDCQKKPADDDSKCVGAHKIINSKGKCVCEPGYPPDGKGNCVDPTDDESWEESVKTRSEEETARGEEVNRPDPPSGEEKPTKGPMEELTESIEEALPPAVKPPKHVPEPKPPEQPKPPKPEPKPPEQPKPPKPEPKPPKPPKPDPPS